MRYHFGGSLAAAAFAFSISVAGAADDRLKPALEAIQPDAILERIRVLASDEFEGRGPGTAGEEKTAAYLIDQFKAMGLEPGNPDGSYEQAVPLVGFQATEVLGAFHAPSGDLTLEFPRTFVAVSRRLAPEVKVENSDAVFVGYGVVAPEYGWDDFKGVDVRGKTLIMLVNDPAVPDPANPAELDPAMFKGKAMTYYGRWTYKYEIAAEKGAAAAILIHEEGPAGYPFAVVQGSWSRENFGIDEPAREGASPRPAVEGWIDVDTAGKLMKACGQDLAALKKAALDRSFQPVPLDAKAEFSIKTELRKVQSRNLVAKVEGADPTVNDEYVVYTAHWDHLGRDAKAEGDQIYNGAIDNASGVATVLEIARGYTKLAPPTRRSALFLFVTAEEKGLLGSKYYASHPLYPLEKTLANINIDVVNAWGPTKDLVSIGMGQSDLDDLMTETAKAKDRTVMPDAEPEKGSYYRSDHFEFAKQGVPALSPGGGRDFIGKPPGYGKQKQDEYTQNDYHKPSDQIKPDWDLSGAVEDARLILEVGVRVGDGDRWPEWKADSEFKARREAMLKAIKP
ncbi:M28 family metallopeptidase [Planctomyces sp. SH-PL62]|uniref:M28 family metallopeptidase n=1 Tax=Planctomyces sp. SH-PL62 TaxID=1636152 RepID=UPI00078CCDBE|nr:M28 family metallopeptidase [Planctomyces sp. SH-PL62]AMV36925.1 Peptidase family M28 [Planctomyces sp. SH-PL62]